MIAGILTLCLTVASGFSVLAAEAEAVAGKSSASGGKSLEDAIVAAKKLVAIPAKYTEFSQYQYEKQEYGAMVEIWQLSWSEPEGKGSVNVEVDASGNIRSYNQYAYRDKTPTLSDLTWEEGKAAAGDFLKKIWPAYGGQMREESESFASDTAAGGRYPSDSFDYVYKLYKNNLPVDFITANITVDKHTKAVTSFYRSSGDPAKFTFKDASGLITAEKASAAYLQNIGMNVEYFTYYDDKNQTPKVFAAYTLSRLAEYTAIDAKTGEAVKRYQTGDGPYTREAAGGAGSQSVNAAEDMGTPELSEEERSAVDTVSGLLSKADAEKIARGMPGIPADKKVESSNLYQMYNDKNTYTWDIGFDNGFVSLDAKTGEIQSYYLYDEQGGKGSKTITASDAKKIAEAFLQQYASKRLGQAQYVNNPAYADLKAVNANTALLPPVSKDNTYRFEYIRLADGVEVNGNNLMITVDAAAGAVTAYRLNWNENLIFPPVKNILSKEEAFKKIADISGLYPCYILTDEKTATPVYTFGIGAVRIDPVTGVRVDWNGQPYRKETQAYTDIKGHWAETMILFLAQNGYYISSEDGHFHPDQNITQANFFQYVYSPAMYDSLDQLYDMLIREGILTKEEVNQSAQVTRQEAAKWMARMLGYDKLTQNGDIFKDIAKDPVEESYKGHVAAILGLKIMSLDAGGSFNGTHPLTNAESVAVIYNYLKVK